MTLIDAAILGVVEGLSEFLPISSTGHLILTSALMQLKQSEAHKVFEVTIQLGAILAVVVLYWKQLLMSPDLARKVCIAFIPTGILGFLLYKTVKAFFIPSLASYMLIAGGFLFLVIERHLAKRSEHHEPLQSVTYRQALLIGTIQSLSMVPGVSRSGATIMGGLLVGLDRKTAAEFSFLLAIPTMCAATGYDLYKNYRIFTLGDGQNILVGFVTSFLFAVIGIRFLLKFISSHTFVPFGIYRIVAGILFLLLLPT